MPKDSFILYTKYSEQISLLSMEQTGVLFVSLLNYQAGKELPKMDAVTEMCFSFIKAQMDSDNEKYEETVQKRAEAGKKGGRPKANGLDDEEPKANESNEKQEKAKKANGFSEKQNNPDNDNDYVNKKERLIDNQSKEKSINQSSLETEDPTSMEITAEVLGTDSHPLSGFLKQYPTIQVDISSTAQLYGKDFELIAKKFSESKYLREKTNSLSWICRSYTDIVCDKYRDSTVTKAEEYEPPRERKKVIGYYKAEEGEKNVFSGL